MGKILCIGDLHFRESLGYSSYIEDGREGEKKEILDFIVSEVKDCEKVVMLGDQLNARNNTSEVIRAFVEFIERFKDKELYILGGNHEKRGNGKSAIDFLEEIKRPNLHVIIREIKKIGKMVFCPYFTKTELDAKDTDEGLRKVLEQMPEGEMLFCHHAISDTLVQSGISTNIFDEIVLPKEELEKRFRLVVGGHIHKPDAYDRTIVTGSIFNNEVGEDGKCIWKINEETLVYECIKLPGRKIMKIENPTKEYLETIDGKGTIVKIILTDKKIDIADIKKTGKRFDACIISEQYNTERKKNKEYELLDFSIENLLIAYSKEKKVDIKKLTEGFNLIKNI